MPDTLPPPIYYNNNTIFIRTFKKYNTILIIKKTKTYTCSVYEDIKRQQSTKIQAK